MATSIRTLGFIERTDEPGDATWEDLACAAPILARDESDDCDEVRVSADVSRLASELRALFLRLQDRVG